MTAFRVQALARHRLDQIYGYTLEHWDEAQAERYIRGLFTRFEAIAASHGGRSRRSSASMVSSAATNST